MRRGLALTAAVTLPVLLTVLASEGSATSLSKQQVTIDLVQRFAASGQIGGSFKLVVVPGHLKTDNGTFTTLESTSSRGIRDGQAYEIGKGTDTLKGTAGTLEIHRSDRIVQAGSGYSVSIGTWTVSNGTGQYEGVHGGGRHAAVSSTQRPVTYIEYGGLLTLP